MCCSDMIETELFEQMVPIKVRLPYKEGQLISLFHDQGQVDKVEHGRGGVTMQGLPARQVDGALPAVS